MCPHWSVVVVGTNHLLGLVYGIKEANVSAVLRLRIENIDPLQNIWHIHHCVHYKIQCTRPLATCTHWK